MGFVVLWSAVVEPQRRLQRPYGRSQLAPLPSETSMEHETNEASGILVPLDHGVTQLRSIARPRVVLDETVHPSAKGYEASQTRLASGYSSATRMGAMCKTLGRLSVAPLQLVGPHDIGHTVVANTQDAYQDSFITRGAQQAGLRPGEELWRGSAPERARRRSVSTACAKVLKRFRHLAEPGTLLCTINSWVGKKGPHGHSISQEATLRSLVHVRVTARRGVADRHSRGSRALLRRKLAWLSRKKGFRRSIQQCHEPGESLTGMHRATTTRVAGSGTRARQGEVVGIGPKECSQLVGLD